MRSRCWGKPVSALAWLVVGVAAALSATAAQTVLRPEVGRFLVAEAGMSDPRFQRSVILLVRYGGDGALGLVVNRATPLNLSEAFPQIDEMHHSTGRLWLGGPVHQGVAAVLLATAAPPEDAERVLETLYFSRSVALMRQLAAAPGRRFRIYAGYAGWAPGQLDAELAGRVWSVLPATLAQVFSDEPEELWRRLDAIAAGTWASRDVGRESPAMSGSVVLPRDLDPEQLSILVDAAAQQHRAAAHGAVLDQFAVTGGAVQQQGVADPAPRTVDVGRLQHLRR